MPRQLKACLCLAGILIVGLIFSAMTVGPAQAQDGSLWDDLKPAAGDTPARLQQKFNKVLHQRIKLLEERIGRLEKENTLQTELLNRMAAAPQAPVVSSQAFDVFLQVLMDQDEQEALRAAQGVLGNPEVPESVKRYYQRLVHEIERRVMEREAHK